LSGIIYESSGASDVPTGNPNARHATPGTSGGRTSRAQQGREAAAHSRGGTRPVRPQGLRRKRDLLFLIANDDLEDVTRKAEAGIRQDASCLQNLLSFFRHHYRFFARQPELSRYLLREMTFYDSGRQAKRFQETRERNIRAVGEIVRIAAANRTIAKLEEPAFVGWVAFCVFQVELRRWLMEGDLNLATGMARLESALRLCMTGWGATPEALAKRRDA
jgi:hypothetical protein